MAGEVGGIVHKGSLEAHQVAGGKGASRDLGSADTAEATPRGAAVAQEPVTINIGWLPAEQPMCPLCHTGLHVVRQNERGDTLFECLQPCAGDGYMAVYRVQVPRWEHFEGRYGKEQPESWKPPVRFADLQRMAEAERAKAAEPQKPAEQPKGAWPGQEDGEAVKALDAPGADMPRESKSVQRRKAAQRAAKLQA